MAGGEDVPLSFSLCFNSKGEQCNIEEDYTHAAFQEQYGIAQHPDDAPHHLRDHRHQQAGSDDIAHAEIHSHPPHQITV